MREERDGARSRRRRCRRRVWSLLLLILATDGTGEINFPDGVPGGYGPASIYLQAACQDAGQPKGRAVSNRVRIDLLP